jgi:phenylpropionate dioxygenase-like ring-hydroxylating dioxygenase large terminal subunit
MVKLLTKNSLKIPLPKRPAPSQDDGWEVPRGWYAVSRSSALKKRDAVPIRYFGRDLVLFRTESGEAHVWDAHCAHNGAHLGYGGTVRGECITCPFHAWKFGPDGRCASIPYLKNGVVPPTARMRTLPVHEHGGIIFAWHGPGEPTFSMPDELGDLPHLARERSHNQDSGKWYPFRHFQMIINGPVQAIVENMVDSVHATELHQMAAFEDVAIKQQGASLNIKFNANHGTEGTKFPTNLLPRTKSSSDGLAVGFGYSRIYITVSTALEALVVFTPTPVEPTVTEVNAYTSVRKAGGVWKGVRNQAVRRIVELGLLRELSQDFVIWNNQKYSKRPVLTRSDAQLIAYRTWARQFYSHGEARNFETGATSASEKSDERDGDEGTAVRTTELVGV